MGDGFEAKYEHLGLPYHHAQKHAASGSPSTESLETSRSHIGEASANGTIHPYETAATCSYLEILSTKVMEAHGQIHHPLAQAVLRHHCSPDFNFIFTGPGEGPVPYATNLGTHIANIRTFKRRHSDMSIVAVNPTATLDENGVDANVWLTIRGCSITKKGAGTSTAAAARADDAVGAANEQLYNRESVAILAWRRRTSDGKWICYRHEGLRGGGDMFP